MIFEFCLKTIFSTLIVGQPFPSADDKGRNPSFRCEYIVHPSVGDTVKPVLFVCPLSREFHDLSEFAKISRREYIF